MFGIDDAALMVGGQIAGGIAGIFGAGQQNAANRDIANNQMRFQQEMSNTAHQREVADLKAAGLNPMLSANAGASTPGGASTQMTNVMEPLANSANEIAKNSIQFKGLNQQLEKQKSDIGVNNETIQLLKEQAKNAKNNATNSAIDAKRNQLQFKYDEQFMDFDNYMKRAEQGLGTITSALNPIKGLRKGKGGTTEYVDKHGEFKGAVIRKPN